jgi:low molecular weight phosphotyrosine protein phosphatase
MVMLFGAFGGRTRKSGKGEEIVDPYYGGEEGFTVAYGQCVKFGKVFLERLEGGELS